MNDAFDALDDEVAHGARSPVSGVAAALGAGEALTTKDKRRVVFELPAYLYVQMAWFLGFGLQMVIFPYLLKNRLEVSGTLLGAAQMALSLPSVVFILIGGVVAERTSGRMLLILFHSLAALPAAFLSLAIGADQLTYWLMLAYAVAMGTVGAFMMPARDAILNEIVARRQQVGSSVTLQQGVAFATLAQFAAQIAGLSLGGMATSWGVEPLLYLQGGAIATGAIAAFFLTKGKMARADNTKEKGVFGDILDGLVTVRSDPLLSSMVIAMFGVGIFVIGAFLVVLPIINADVYGLNSGGLRNIFVTFWAGAFVSSVALSLAKTIARPGRLQMMSFAIGATCVLIMWFSLDYYAFLFIVFIWGLCAGVSITMSRTIVQNAAPPAQLARVLSIYQLGFMGGAPLGAAMMGVLTDAVGPRNVALVPGLGLLTLVLVMLICSPIWRISSEDLPSQAKPPDT